MAYQVFPLTPERWSALEDLFGPNGACGGCWCMYWRIGSAYRKRSRDQNKADFRAVVKRGPPPGLLAFDGELAVGWCQLTPRSVLPKIETARLTRRVDDVAVWTVSCFFVRRGYRKQGVTKVLIDAALEAARRARAPALEAYPVEVETTKSGSSLYTGVASAFARAGFKAIARHAPHRPVMRYELAGLCTLTSSCSLDLP